MKNPIITTKKILILLYINKTTTVSKIKELFTTTLNTNLLTFLEEKRDLKGPYKALMTLAIAHEPKTLNEEVSSSLKKISELLEQSSRDFQTIKSEIDIESLPTVVNAFFNEMNHKLVSLQKHKLLCTMPGMTQNAIIKELELYLDRFDIEQPNIRLMLDPNIKNFSTSSSMIQTLLTQKDFNYTIELQKEIMDDVIPIVSRKKPINKKQTIKSPVEEHVLKDTVPIKENNKETLDMATGSEEDVKNLFDNLNKNRNL